MTKIKMFASNEYFSTTSFHSISKYCEWGNAKANFLALTSLKKSASILATQSYERTIAL